MLVSSVHPVVALSALFWTICSLLILVADAIGAQMVLAYSITGLVMVL